MAKNKSDAEENEAANEDGEGEGKKVGGKKKLVIIAAVLLLLIGGGAGAYFAGLFGGDDKGKKTEEVAEEEEGGHGEDSGHGEKEEVKLDEHGKPIPSGPTFYEMPEFLVNLSTTGTKVSFLKMKVSLELKDAALVPKVDKMRPRIEDAVNTYLRELRSSDLSGSAGIYRLREELLLRINKALEPDKVEDILFSEIIVQ